MELAVTILHLITSIHQLKDRSTMAEVLSSSATTTTMHSSPLSHSTVVSMTCKYFLMILTCLQEMVEWLSCPPSGSTCILKVQNQACMMLSWASLTQTQPTKQLESAMDASELPPISSMEDKSVDSNQAKLPEESDSLMSTVKLLVLLVHNQENLVITKLTPSHGTVVVLRQVG